MLRLMLVTSVALGFSASTAAASELSTREAPRKLIFNAAPGEANRVVVQQTGDSFTVSDAGAAITVGEVQAGSCLSEGLSQVRCTLPPDFRVDVDLGDLDDSIEYAIQATGSVDGGAGADTLLGGDGEDHLDGGTGDDRLRGALGADRLAGGEGHDVLDYSDATLALSVTPDGVADDGVPGEGDNVSADVESVTGGSGADALTAGVAGGELDGGAGDDILTGSAGADRLVGGAGTDSFSAGDGDDAVVARDEVAETVACGAGSDSAVGDRADAFADCETLDLPALPPVPEAEAETAEVAAAEAAVDPRLREAAPVPGRTFGAATERGKVLVRVPGANRFVALGTDGSIPMGATIDARRGAVSIVSAHDLAGHEQGASFSSGVFVIRQTRSAKLVTRLHLVGGSFGSCRTTATASARKRPPVRRLWGSGKGKFSMHGRQAVATVRGTVWSVSDYCSGTLTKVESGVVDVRDLGRRKTVRVRAGGRYLARRR
jgi:hypothetical protein